MGRLAFFWQLGIVVLDSIGILVSSIFSCTLLPPTPGHLVARNRVQALLLLLLLMKSRDTRGCRPPEGFNPVRLSTSHRPPTSHEPRATSHEP